MTQPNQSEPVNKVEVCMWKLRDIEETIADATPDELPELHAKLLALSSGLTDFIIADRKRVALEARISTLKKLKNTRPNAELDDQTSDYLRGYREMEAKIGFELNRLNKLKELEATKPEDINLSDYTLEPFYEHNVLRGYLLKKKENNE